jgi:hypothetical protein
MIGKSAENQTILSLRSSSAIQVWMEPTFASWSTQKEFRQAMR